MSTPIAQEGRDFMVAEASGGDSVDVARDRDEVTF